MFGIFVIRCRQNILQSHLRILTLSCFPVHVEIQLCHWPSPWRLPITDSFFPTLLYTCSSNSSSIPCIRVRTATQLQKNHFKMLPSNLVSYQFSDDGHSSDEQSDSQEDFLGLNSNSARRTTQNFPLLPQEARVNTETNRETLNRFALRQTEKLLCTGGEMPHHGDILSCPATSQQATASLQPEKTRTETNRETLVCTGGEMPHHGDILSCPATSQQATASLQPEKTRTETNRETLVCTGGEMPHHGDILSCPATSQQATASLQPEKTKKYAICFTLLPTSMQKFFKELKLYFTKPINLQRQKLPVADSTYAKTQERLLCE